jgi:hypothetical protein
MGIQEQLEKVQTVGAVATKEFSMLKVRERPRCLAHVAGL